MNAVMLAIADAPLALLAYAGWRAGGHEEASPGLERLAASAMLLASSACLWNGLAGPELLWRDWLAHAGLAVLTAALRSAGRNAAVDLPLPVLLGRAAAYVGGFALAAVSCGWSFGQNAPSAW